MQLTTIGKTSITISRIGVGTNKVGGHNYFSDLNEEEGKGFVKEAIGLGVNFIDTADVYGHGRSEELIGEVLSSPEIKREELVIATKGGNEWNAEGKSWRNNRPDYLRSALEASLRRLRLDYVDLYYLHFPDEETPLAESIGELNRLKAEGKIRAIGVSNLTIEQLKEAVKHAEIAALQAGYNMLDRNVEKELLPFCAEHAISFIPYFPLASGLLSGKYTTETVYTNDDARYKRFKSEKYRDNLLKVDQLKALADKKKTTLSNLALAWLLAQKGVTAVIPGGRRPEQARGIVQADDLTLSREDLKNIDAILK
ncbi:aldo/keto reductase [Camelliibacillus cellulosilyticus]|uniref:Aldo/keto reductase n=1 Tax=Camelliibacillus cellulosilyticus TaxID=2174486 RepID=A0ABV9GMG2_9BACL